MVLPSLRSLFPNMVTGMSNFQLSQKTVTAGSRKRRFNLPEDGLASSWRPPKRTSPMSLVSLDDERCAAACSTTHEKFDKLQSVHTLHTIKTSSTSNRTRTHHWNTLPSSVSQSDISNLSKVVQSILQAWKLSSSVHSQEKGFQEATFLSRWHFPHFISVRKESTIYVCLPSEFLAAITGNIVIRYRLQNNTSKKLNNGCRIVENRWPQYVVMEQVGGCKRTCRRIREVQDVWVSVWRFESIVKRAISMNLRCVENVNLS